MKSLYLASGNPHKSFELTALLADKKSSWSVKPPAGGMPEVDECGDTFLANAKLKARALSEILTGEWIISDDSGLEVDALQGAPGVHSARYAGQDATSQQMIDKLLYNLSDIELERRTARFICVLFVITSEGEEYSFEGKCEGAIALDCRGGEGFGYDPIFIPQGYSKSFAELGQDVKSSVSHRARALRCLAEWLV